MPSQKSNDFCRPLLVENFLRNELATQWRQTFIFWIFLLETWQRPLAQGTRDTIGDLRNARSSRDFLPLHWVAGNVHSQGSKSFPRCIDAWPAGGVPSRGPRSSPSGIGALLQTSSRASCQDGSSSSNLANAHPIPYQPQYRS